MPKARILIVEDEAIIAMELESQLQSLGYELTSIVDTGEKAIEKAEIDKPDLILMDIRIKGEMDGIDTAEVLRNTFNIPVIFSTAYLDEERINRAKITMPFGYVLKPLQERDLKVTIEMALYVAKVDTKRKRVEALLRIQRDLGIALGKSIEFHKMIRLCLRAALDASEMESGGIYIVDSVTKSLDLAYHEGLSEEFVSTVSHYEADSPNSQMVLAGDPIFSVHKELGLSLKKVEHQENLRAIAIIPIKQAKQVVGCLHVASHTYHEVPQFSRSTLETIASQIGDAIVKKQVENALVEKEERFRTIFEKSFQFALILDTDGIIVEMNQLCYDVCGRLAEGSLGKPIENALWWNDYPDVREKTKNAICDVKNGNATTDQIVFIDKDKVLHNGIRIISPITNENGKLTWIAVVGLDVTKQIQAEEEIQKIKNILLETIDSSISITNVK